MIRKVNVKDIHPNPFQTRKNQDVESIVSLADEIAKVGLWTGALRGREKNGHIELCFGHRRLEAVKLLAWKQVEVDVVELTDEEMSLQGMIENLQRTGLNDADKGDGIIQYIKIRQVDSNKINPAVMKELVDALGLKEERIYALIRVSRLDEDSKELIREKKLPGVAAIVADRIGGSKAIATAAKKGFNFHAE